MDDLKPLSERQSVLLAFIRRNIEQGFPVPTIQQMQEHMGISSPNGIVGHAGDAPDPDLPVHETVRKVRVLCPLPLGCEVVRSQEYCRQECFSVAEQAAAALKSA